MINYKTSEPHVGLCMDQLRALGNDTVHSRLAVEINMEVFRKGLEMDKVLTAASQLFKAIKRNLENEEN